MSSRRSSYEGNGCAGKLVRWIIIALIIVWAARNPHEATTVVHSIAAGIGHLASHYGQHS